jgi:hypothetical protein
VLFLGNINYKLRLSQYPIRRTLPLVEAISRDFNNQLLRILISQRIPYTPYETLERLLNQTTAILSPDALPSKCILKIPYPITIIRSTIPIRLQQWLRISTRRRSRSKSISSRPAPCQYSEFGRTAYTSFVQNPDTLDTVPKI